MIWLCLLEQLDYVVKDLLEAKKDYKILFFDAVGKLVRFYTVTQIADIKNIFVSCVTDTETQHGF